MPKRPAFLKNAALPATEAITAPRRDMVEQHISPANRQNVPFENPAAAYMRAKARILDRHDAARKEQQLAGGQVQKADTFDMEKFREECRDHSAIHHYEHHFTTMRGSNTQKRSNIVTRKT